MNHKQKFGYTILGTGIMALRITIEQKGALIIKMRDILWKVDKLNLYALCRANHIKKLLYPYRDMSKD